jgi:hypothetical protein
MVRYIVEGSARNSEEMRERERLKDPERVNMIRKAAEVHRRVRKYTQDELLVSCRSLRFHHTYAQTLWALDTTPFPPQ